MLHGYVKDHFRRPLEYRTLDFESRASDSYSTFGRSLDLLGFSLRDKILYFVQAKFYTARHFPQRQSRKH